MSIAARVAPIVLVIAVFAPPTRAWLFAHGARWLYLMASALALALVIVPVVRACARRAGVLDQPSARKVHQVPTPLLGGAAVYAAFAVTVLLNFSFSRELKGVALGGAVVVALGIWDDIADLPAWSKLAGQVAATLLAMSYGAMLTVVPHAVPGAAVLNAVVTALWFVTVTNAVQFLDGMDGLAAGLGAIAGVFFSAFLPAGFFATSGLSRIGSARSAGSSKGSAASTLASTLTTRPATESAAPSRVPSASAARADPNAAIATSRGNGRSNASGRTSWLRYHETAPALAPNPDPHGGSRATSRTSAGT